MGLPVPVDESGTRPIVLLNESDHTVRVVYTSSEGYNNILVRTSSTASINFGSAQTVMSGGLNDVTSTKENWTSAVLVWRRVRRRPSLRS